MSAKNLQQRWEDLELRDWLSAEARRIGVNETRYLQALVAQERERIEAGKPSSVAHRIPTRFRLHQLRARGIVDAVRAPKAKPGPKPKRAEFIGPPPPKRPRGRPRKKD